MRPSRFFLFLAAVTALPGCASVATYQATCEEKFPRFTDMVACLQDAVAADPRPAQDPSGRVRLYMMTAADLREKVAAGQLTDSQARLQLQQTFVDLKGQQDRDVSSAIQAFQRNQRDRAQANERRIPTNTTCYTLGSTLNCTTQ